MRLKKLIISSENNGDIIRDVTFREQGFSLIVDKDSLQGGSGNNIGKSTFAKLIDICLGAKNVNSIYHDSETDDDELIKSFIEEKKIQVTLFVEDNGKEHSVRRELWKGGKYYIDSEKIRSYSDYCESIKAFAIPDAGKDISLRSVLPFFIRLEWNGQDLFKYLHPSTKYYQYRLYFQYLLGISLNPQPLDLEKSIQEKENENKKILSKNAACSIDDINQAIKNKNNELSQKVGKLKSDKVVTSFSSDKENARLQTLLDETTQRVNDTEEEISILKAKIKSEENGIGKIDTEALRLLYTDGKLFLKDLMHDFSDLVNFHDGMVKKRIESYQKKVDELTILLNHEKEELNVARREYTDQFID